MAPGPGNYYPNPFASIPDGTSISIGNSEYKRGEFRCNTPDKVGPGAYSHRDDIMRKSSP